MQGINPNYENKSKSVRSVSYYVDGLQDGNRYILSECITLAESASEEKRTLATQIIHQAHKSNTTIRIGITGTPGVGKSTFIETFGLFLIDQGYKPAVLAIDPSSQVNKGSILGDKTRMQYLSSNENAFVRPTPSGNVLGGTAAFTKETIQLCEAAGFDVIIVETVGVGQSETEVDFITDVNLLLLQPGAGDDIQGIKRGIMENADIFIINKSDGPQLELAKQTCIAYQNAIQLFHHDTDGWQCPVILVSSTEKTGFDRVWKAINDYKNNLINSGLFLEKRKEQEVRWFTKQSAALIQQLVFNHPNVKKSFDNLVKDIRTEKVSGNTAIQEMEKTLKNIIQK
jgi:LAO/AO transport system kinase